MCITNLHYYSTGNQCSALEAAMPRGSVSSVSELGSALKGFYVGAVPAKTGTLKVRSSDGSALFFSSYSYTFWPILLQSTSSFSRTLLHTNTSARNGRGVATPILSHLVDFRAQFLFLFPSSLFPCILTYSESIIPNHPDQPKTPSQPPAQSMLFSSIVLSRFYDACGVFALNTEEINLHKLFEFPLYSCDSTNLSNILMHLLSSLPFTLLHRCSLLRPR